MKYLLKNITITTAQNTKGAYSWLRASLFNDEDIFANPTQLPVYNNMTQEVIDAYLPYATDDPARPGVKVVNQESLMQAIKQGACPDILHISQIHPITMPLTAPYGRIYRTDVKNVQTGAIEHQAGDWVIPANQTAPTPVTAITLYLKKGYDNETQQYNWVEAPERVLQRYLESSYRPLPIANVTAQAPNAPQNPEQRAEAQQDAMDALAQVATLGTTA